MSAPALAVRGLVRRAGGRVLLEDVSLEAREGELLAVLGPSGAGKTTLLRALAGLDAPDSGEILLEGAPASAPGRVLVAPADRGVALVPQSLALWPHMTVEGHLAFPLRAAGRPADEAARAARQTADSLGLSALLDRLPAALSGGEQQRVALGRALAGRPRLLLLDEPVSSLDPHLRDAARAQIRALQRRLGVAALYVTHDRAEALELADRVVVLAGGRVVQQGLPRDVYDRPADAFTARFLGAVNELRGRRRGGRLELEGGLALEAPGADGEAVLLLRPEDLDVRPEGEPGWPAEVESCAFRGESWLAVLRCGSVRLKAACPAPPETKASVAVRPGRAKVYPL